MNLLQRKVLLKKIAGIEIVLEPEEEIVELYKTDMSRNLSGPTVVGKIDLPVEEKKKQLLISLLKLTVVMMISEGRRKGKGSLRIKRLSL